jgi:hypothetical protein
MKLWVEATDAAMSVLVGGPEVTALKCPRSQTIQKTFLKGISVLIGPVRSTSVPDPNWLIFINTKAVSDFQ